jgi:hypothetical protein
MSKTRTKKSNPKAKASQKRPAQKSRASAQKGSARKSVQKEQAPMVLPFGRMNYILLAIGVAVIGLGFLLMSLDDFVDATQFSISLYVAPFVVVAGFVEIIYAILYKAPQEPGVTPPSDS